MTNKSSIFTMLNAAVLLLRYQRDRVGQCECAQTDKEPQHVPSDEALAKPFLPALSNISKKWVMSIHYCKGALNRFKVQSKSQLHNSGPPL